MIIIKDACSVLMNPGEPVRYIYETKAISSYEKYLNKKTHIMVKITLQPDSFWAARDVLVN